MAGPYNVQHTPIADNQPMPQKPAAPDDIRLNVSLPLPLDLVGELTTWVGTRYPNATITHNGVQYSGLTITIPASDYYAPVEPNRKPLDEIAQDRLQDPETTAFLTALTSNGIQTSLPGWLSTLLSSFSTQVLDTINPENYVELSVTHHHGDTRPFKWIICKPGQPSPHDLRQKAQASYNALRDQLEETLDAAHHEDINPDLMAKLHTILNPPE